MRKYIRKADIILFIFLVIAGLAASAAVGMSRNAAGSGARVVIESGGKLYAAYSLYEDRIIEVPAPGSDAAGDAASNNRDSEEAAAGSSDAPGSHGNSGGGSSNGQNYNIIEIRDGEVSVTEASCHNQVCVRHAPISASGESIVCLPNRLMVRIEGGPNDEGGDEYDSITS